MVRKTWAEGGSWATYFAEKNTTTGGNYGPADKNAWTAGYSNHGNQLQFPCFQC